LSVSYQDGNLRNVWPCLTEQFVSCHTETLDQLQQSHCCIQILKIYFAKSARLSRSSVYEHVQIKRDVIVTVTGTAGVKKSLLGLYSWIAAAEEVSLRTASEGGKRRCRRDVLGQTVYITIDLVKAK